MLSRRLGFLLFLAMATFVQNAHADEPKEASEPSSASSAAMWGGLSVAAVGLAVGTGAGILSMTASSRVDEKCGHVCPVGVGNDVDDAALFAKIALIGVTVGSIGLGVGIVGLLTREPLRYAKPQGASARLNVGPTSIGIAGSF